ncbi:cell wall elongation regulator TseB-like domain-containing protein [Niallia sp. 03133]|uniref:cell wall elongation regulator TseB-like domain-containing protein n=1 Tax=Niallia sp. 03133 TaxID=3458060 RepID=UPI004044E5CB
MKKWIWITVIAALILLGFVINIYLNAVEPVKAASSKAKAIAEEKAGLKSVDNVTLFHGTDKHTYSIVEGSNAKKEKLIVWIEEKKQTVTVKKQKDGITKNEAIRLLIAEKSSDKIDTVRLGMIKGIPSWEIYTHSVNNLINYYYLDFETGEILLKIENI